jgi:hypothetical protein
MALGGFLAVLDRRYRARSLALPAGKTKAVPAMTGGLPVAPLMASKQHLS